MFKPQTRWVHHHQLVASKRNILIPRLLKMILLEINRFAPPAAIWFCVVASFNSDFEINYLFWSDRTGWFVYRRLGASNLKFNNPLTYQQYNLMLTEVQMPQMGDCSSLQRWGVHIVSAPNPVGKPPPTFCLKTEHLDPPMTKNDTV